MPPAPKLIDHGRQCAVSHRCIGWMMTLVSPQAGQLPASQDEEQGVDGGPAAPFVLPAAGERIDQFRVVAFIGRGGIGSVLLARDELLGRPVALKLIRPDRLDTRRMDAMWAEGRITAQLSHPNIVTIYGLGHWGDAPYLALEYVPGETLRQRLNSGQVGLSETLRIGVAVARALAAAHELGVVHCDLKPENILVPPDGRLRVVDFGIASAALDGPLLGGPGGAMLAGTPEYMAPERFDGKPAGAPVDLWALGILLYELAAGQRPHQMARELVAASTLPVRVTEECRFATADSLDVSGGEQQPSGQPGVVASQRWRLAARVADPGWNLPNHPRMDPQLHALIAQLLHRDPWQRPAAAEVVERLTRMLERGESTDRDAAPFRGLAAFEERHAAHFFGRDAELDALAERVRRSTVVLLVGPSGVGKSSLVQAGLVPRMREAGLRHVLALRPGARPLAALAARLLELDSGAVTTDTQSRIETLAQRIEAEPGHVNVVLHELAASWGQLLLFVDQFEEVVTLGAPAAQAQAFVQAVLGAADPIDRLVRVVVTLRDDQLVHVGGGDAMRAALGHMELVRRPGPQALRDAVLRPLQRLNYRIDDPTIVDRMVAEVGDRPAALPLLQFACTQLWERRDGTAGVLRAADYAAIGGVVGALASHAEAQLAGLETADLDAARHLLLRLVTPEGSRQVVPREQALEGLGEPGLRVAERLLSARLLQSRRPTASAVWLLELAHESLVKLWPQLVVWIEESGEERAAVAEVTQAAGLWRQRGGKVDGLWALDSVRDFERRLRAVRQPLGEAERAFLAASVRHGKRGQRRQRFAVVGLLMIMAMVTLATVLTSREFKARTLREMEHQRQIHLAAADMGVVQLHLELWQRDADGQEQTVATRSGDLQWALHDEDPVEQAGPGAERLTDSVRRMQRSATASGVLDTVETRSGPAWLRVWARHPQTDRPCDDAWIRLVRLPGYRDRQQSPPRLQLWVPTCAESARDMVAIPAGPFRFAVAPPEGSTATVVREETRNLPAFEMDIHEVSNAQFQRFAGMNSATGVTMPQYPPTTSTAELGAPDRPVTMVTWHQAAQYCRSLGKRLPTEAQWVKAARGGLYLDTAQMIANPLPERSHPWGNEEATGRAQIGGTEGSVRGALPVYASPGDVSPYGVRNLSGNVSEWTATLVAGHSSLAVLRGGSWGQPLGVGLHRNDRANMRYRSIPNLGTGLRCVRGAP